MPCLCKVYEKSVQRSARAAFKSAEKSRFCRNLTVLSHLRCALLVSGSWTAIEAACFLAVALLLYRTKQSFAVYLKRELQTLIQSNRPSFLVVFLESDFCVSFSGECVKGAKRIGICRTVFKTNSSGKKTNQKMLSKKRLPQRSKETLKEAGTRRSKAQWCLR